MASQEIDAIINLYVVRFLWNLDMQARFKVVDRFRIIEAR